MSLDVDTGATLSGWPVNVNAKARYNVLAFISAIQNQRGALALVNGTLVYPGAGPNELMSGTSKWNTGIVARGRVYFAGANKVYAFVLP